MAGLEKLKGYEMRVERLAEDKLNRVFVSLDYGIYFKYNSLSIQQALIECLVNARHCSRFWACSSSIESNH